ncbi:MAG: protein serine/threonine phosphatase 2C family protein [Gammaproteobacteria bacterium]|nr:protein serine/threonine phosphatase 2C family protein [Gammaproteobacteria bacterium]
MDELQKLPSFRSRDYQTALRENFIKMDELLKSPQGQKEIRKYQAPEESQGSIFGRPETDNIALYTGCTACVALITPHQIFVANSGDSRCVLGRDGKSIEMSEDHKPDN